MPSSPQFCESSPVRGTGIRKSRFTYRHLSQLATYNTACPLRVIAHIDLDAFYAQCEMVRLGLPLDKPLAVQQWQGLIAINYPARSFGISRHCTLPDAKKLCPELIAQHVATWREGDDKWAYRDDAAANIATDKVSLDPYRLESRKILALIKASLPPKLQKVEKASIDEVFCDLSAHTHATLLERFPELANPPPYDDPAENLPRPPVAALDWKADALIDLDDDAESEDPDWDDVAILIGSEIIRDVRAQILEKLHYTCSAGIASNKMLSKLGSAHKKPNQQTVIRNRAVEYFLSDFKFTKIRNLGGKLGENVVNTFHTDTIKELLPIPLDQMKSRLGDDTGTWVYNAIRGIEFAEVNSRTQIKSMLSAKSFRPTIGSAEQADRWLRIFVADIFSRLVEEGVLENKRRPKTMNLHHRQGTQTKSRQAPISQGKAIDEKGLLELAKNLLGQIISEGNVWPCANLSLSVGGFEDGVTGNMGIGAFLVKGEEAQALRAEAAAAASSSKPEPYEGHPSKKRRTGIGGQGIQRFLKKQVSTDEAPPSPGSNGDGEIESSSAKGVSRTAEGSPNHATAAPAAYSSIDGASDAHAESSAHGLLKCERCHASFDEPEELQSHVDWHFAKDLQDEERGNSAFAPRPEAVLPRPVASRGGGGNTLGERAGTSSSSKRGGARRGGKKLEQGQSKLRFR